MPLHTSNTAPRGASTHRPLHRPSTLGSALRPVLADGPGPLGHVGRPSAEPASQSHDLVTCTGHNAARRALVTARAQDRATCLDARPAQLPDPRTSPRWFRRHPDPS